MAAENPARLLNAETVKSVPRPAGVSDDFILESQKEIGQVVEAVYRMKQEHFSYQTRFTEVAVNMANAYVSHLAHEPRLEDWFIASGRVPPLFEHELIAVPCNPDCPPDKEVIPPAFLAKYAKYGKKGEDLDYVRNVCRKPYMRDHFFYDIVAHDAEYTAPVPVTECYDDQNRLVVIAACGFTLGFQHENFLATTLVPSIGERLLHHLRLHHAVDSMPEGARRKRFGTLQYTVGVRHRETHGTIVYMRLAPAPTREEDLKWMPKDGTIEDREFAPNSREYVLQSLEDTRAYKEGFADYYIKKRLDTVQTPAPLNPLDRGAPDLGARSAHYKAYKEEKDALEAALARDKEKEEEEEEGDI